MTQYNLVIFEGWWSQGIHPH